MKTTPHREIDRGPVLNWIADRLMDLGSFIVGKTSPYALMYTVSLDNDEDEDEENSIHVCDESCGVPTPKQKRKS